MNHLHFLCIRNDTLSEIKEINRSINISICLAFNHNNEILIFTFFFSRLVFDPEENKSRNEDLDIYWHLSDYIIDRVVFFATKVNIGKTIFAFNDRWKIEGFVAIDLHIHFIVDDDDEQSQVLKVPASQISFSSLTYFH